MKYKGRLYDLSYGVMYQNEIKLSEEAIEAFYKIVYKYIDEREIGYDMNGDGIITEIKEYPVYYIKKNPSGLQIKIIYIPY